MLLEMSTDVNEHGIADAAALIADVGRATMLLALLDGRALSAGELARAANISAQTASNHLQKLLESDFVVVQPAGRHRYYRLANTEVAHVLEALTALAPRPRTVRCGCADEPMRYARTCYDHLAGRLGVRLAQALQRRSWIEQNGGVFTIHATGCAGLERFGIEVATLSNKRNAARACMDWTERHHHIGGALGRALFEKFLADGWFVRSAHNRSLVLTNAGRRGLLHAFDLCADD